MPRHQFGHMISQRFRPITGTAFPVRRQLPNKIINRAQRPPHPRRLEPRPHRRDLPVHPRPEMDGPFPQHSPGQRNRPPKPFGTRSRSRRPTDLHLNIGPTEPLLIGRPKCPDRQRQHVIPAPGNGITASKPQIMRHEKPHSRRR
ncbi:hypothetical protein [Paractinoplanes atraurantiacus]|uniref:Uncharacterized protein n=1 Tax=Paractinoplanes atraurantiacus TaxID=1036182 RepID=A0A285J5A1_9ACTN|nr:hypothetical protein [Actinoplanes atraurantiacus]SNY54536.1 hypothetical protein SAMN05421748_11596 [Actinoplanes atraurantiacus]